MSSEGSEARQRWIARGVDFMLIVIGALVLMLPSLWDGAPAGQDYPYHVTWIKEFSAQMASGDWYPRWLDGLWLGSGGADFFFYAPLPFWLTGAAALGICSGCNADQLLVVAGVVLLALSGLGFRALAGQFAGRPAANVAALVYMALPFHLAAQWYARMAFGEFAAVAFVPWHLAAFLDCVHGGKSGPKLALFSALIVFSHLPTALILATAYLVPLAVIGCQRGGRSITAPLFASIIGLGLAAIYFVPALTLLDSVRTDLLLLPKLTWRLNLLWPQNFGRSVFFDWLWPSFAVLTLLSLTALFVTPVRQRHHARTAIAFLMVVWVMVTPLSIPLWAATPIERIQFPWRFLLVTDVAFALAAAMATQTLVGQGGARFRRMVAAALLSAMTVTIVAVHPAANGSYGIGNPPKSSVHPTAGSFGFLPIETLQTIGTHSYRHFHELAEDRAALPAVTLLGTGNAKVVSDHSRSLTIDVDLTAPTPVILRRTFWRYWRLRDVKSGRDIDIRPTEDFPLIAAELPAGRGRYVLELPTLPAERIGAAISGISLVVLLVWFRLSRRRTGS